MKTTRTNCFETNSSSTHSLTVFSAGANLKPIYNFVGDDAGEVHVKVGNVYDVDSTPIEKLGFLLTYASVTGSQELFDRVVKIAADFSKLTIVPDKAEVEGEPLDEDEYEDVLSDDFYKFTNEYGHGSVEDFKSSVDEIIEDDASILAFIFGAGGFDRTEHYDG